MNGDAFRLTLPSRSEHLGTARSFAAAVARHYDVVGEAVEDLKLAISEACVDALVAGAPIQVHAEWAPSEIAFRVDAPGGGKAAEQAAPDDLGAPTRFELIRSLFPDATVATEAGRREIRFSLSVG